MTDIVVGCPVRRREWIIEQWVDHVERACSKADMEPVYSFVVDRNDPTVDQLRLLLPERAVVWNWEVTGSSSTGIDQRVWNVARFETMVHLRNQLLKTVRAISPRYFWSVDSDILVHPDALKLSLDAFNSFDAVGGKCFMYPTGTEYPSCGWYQPPEGLFRRTIDTEGVIPVGVIMAMKLMAPEAYKINYVFDRYAQQGEDVAFSVACTLAGLKLGWDSRVCSKHVMQPEHLNRYDERCGW